MPVDRENPPPLGTIRAYDFPEVLAGTLGNGLALKVARLARLPVVTAALVLPAAAESELDDARAGVAVLTGDALEGGTGHRSGAQLAEALERIGASLHVGSGWDATTVSLSCLADRFEEGLALLAELALAPEFPEDEVARVRSQRLAQIRHRAMDPASLANDRANALFYADGVPYGRPVGGTVESVTPFDPGAARAFHEARYLPSGGGLVVVGDVDLDEVSELAGRLLGRWGRDHHDATGPAADVPVDARPRSTARTVHVVHRAGAVQSEVRVGHVGCAVDAPGYFPLIVANTVLGGAFTSRLNLNLRERHGFTYGVRSSFAWRRGAGPFTVSAAVGSEVTAAAVREIVGELEGIVGDGPTEDEIDSARDYAAGVFPLRFETTGQVAGRIAELIIYGLPDDWNAHYRERIREVDVPAALEASRRHIRPHEAAIVIVGDADRVRAPLEALELGPVEVHES